MAPNILAPDAEEIVIRTADFTELRFVVSFRGQEFTLVGLPDQVNVCPNGNDDDESKSYVRRGSSRSGAIWKHGECIADYFVEQDGKYVVTEVKESFRLPETRFEADPVIFLLTSLWTQLAAKH